MKYLLYLLIIGFVVFSCGSTNKTISQDNTDLPEGAVRIANDSLEYEIIVFDNGYEYYLEAIAKPEWYYTQSFLETKNQFYVTTWNIRVNEPFLYNPEIYEQVIHYDFTIDYGFEVNYKLFNYFKFVEWKYHQVF